MKEKHLALAWVLILCREMKLEYIELQCRACEEPLCKVEIHSEIVKSYRCPNCFRMNYFNGEGHVESHSDERNIIHSSGKRFL